MADGVRRRHRTTQHPRRLTTRPNPEGPTRGTDSGNAGHTGNTVTPIPNRPDNQPAGINQNPPSDKARWIWAQSPALCHRQAGRAGPRVLGTGPSRTTQPIMSSYGFASDRPLVSGPAGRREVLPARARSQALPPDGRAVAAGKVSWPTLARSGSTRRLPRLQARIVRQVHTVPRAHLVARADHTAS